MWKKAKILEVLLIDGVGPVTDGIWINKERGLGETTIGLGTLQYYKYSAKPVHRAIMLELSIDEHPHPSADIIGIIIRDWIHQIWIITTSRMITGKSWLTWYQRYILIQMYILKYNHVYHLFYPT